MRFSIISLGVLATLMITSSVYARDANSIPNDLPETVDDLEVQDLTGSNGLSIASKDAATAGTSRNQANPAGAHGLTRKSYLGRRNLGHALHKRVSQPPADAQDPVDDDDDDPNEFS